MAAGANTSLNKNKKKTIYGSGTSVKAAATPTQNMVAGIAKGSGSSGVTTSGVPAQTSAQTVTGASSNYTPPTINQLTNTPVAGAGQSQDASGNLGQAYTGWATGLRPDAANLMFQEPQSLLRQVMAKMGMSANNNQGMYQMALPNADLANALALIGLGGQPGFEQGDINSVINNMGDFFKQGLTRGGQGTDFQQGASNIINAGKDTALGGYLDVNDPQGQYQAAASLFMPLAEAGLHPLFAKAFQNQLERLRDEYYQRYGYGTPPTSFTGMVGDRLGVGR